MVPIGVIKAADGTKYEGEVLSQPINGFHTSLYQEFEGYNGEY